jgi:hypothetical protein
VASVDEQVEPQQIFGKVVAVERHNKMIDLDGKKPKMIHFVGFISL